MELKGSPQKSSRSEVSNRLRAFAECFELGVSNVRINRAKPGKGPEAAVRASNHPLPSHDIDKALDALGEGANLRRVEDGILRQRDSTPPSRRLTDAATIISNSTGFCSNG